MVGLARRGPPPLDRLLHVRRAHPTANVNAAVEQIARARAAVEAAGCRLRFLPTDSPDLNPIELAVATCKQAPHTAKPRPFEAVAAAVGRTLAAVTPGDASAFFRAAGYPA